MMTLPLNKKQKQLVEKSMDLVPIMIRSMTRTAAYVLRKNNRNYVRLDIWLCAGRLSDLRKEDHSSLMPKLSSVMPSLTTGGKLPVTAPCSVLWTKHHLKMNISIIVICFPTRIHKQLTRKRTQTRPCFLSI